MERYEAILEQLKKAQSRGMETITNRLDIVVKSLEELIQEASSSIQGALPESADECLPVDEVIAALDAYREEADSERRRSAELDARIAELEGAARDPQPGTPIELIRALDSAGSQSELLKELLPAISEHVARAVVLVLRDGKVSAWSGIGFADGEVLRSWQGDTAESSALTKLLEVSKPVRFAPAEDDLFERWFADGDAPDEVLLIPVVLRGKLMGTVYVDRIDNNPWNPETAQTLVAQVCWLIDTLQYRQATATSLAEPIKIEKVIEGTEPEETPAEEVEESPTEEVTVTQDEPESPVTTDEEPENEAEDEAYDQAGKKTEEYEEEGELEGDDEPTDEGAEQVEEEPDEPEEDDDLEASEVDPSATMKIDVSGVGFGDTSPEDEITGESFEPDGPAEVELEPEVGSENFEPEAPAAPDFDEEPAAEFEPDFDEEPEKDTEEVAREESAEVEVQATSTESTVIPTEVQMPVATPPAEDVEDAEEPKEEEEEEAAEEDSQPKTSRFLDEPPPVKPVQPPPEEPEEEISEEEAQREEARRFARLLVSEIKLYNEEQVERGRETKDLYQRLQEDINRSREMFEKRISPEVRENQDYFQDELVRILADGDPDALGM